MFKSKQLLTGILAGALISMPIHMHANDLKTKVETWATPYIQFIFDDQIVPLPLGYTVLNYEGRTYVPTRFVAEQLGAEVEWDEATQTISITSKPDVECPAPEAVPENPKQDDDKKDEDTDKEDSKEKIDYRKIPQTQNLRGAAVSITSVTVDDDYTRVYVALENRQNRPIQLRQMSAELNADGETYKLEDVPSFRWDARLWSDAREDETLEGYLAFPKISEDVSEATIKFELIYNDGSGDKEELEYHIKF